MVTNLILDQFGSPFCCVRSVREGRWAHTGGLDDGCQVTAFAVCGNESIDSVWAEFTVDFGV